MSEDAKILTCDFEVFGMVKVISFKLRMQMQAKIFGARGWCMDTMDDSVKGSLEATPVAFPMMRHWLEEVGSPDSIIDRTVFSETQKADDYTFNTFEILDKTRTEYSSNLNESTQ